MGDVTGAVVGHDRLDGDAAVVEPLDGTPEEGSGRGRSFVGEDLGVGHARRVVDGDVDELPPDASRSDRMISVHPVTDTSDTTQLLDIDVDELARLIPLVAKDGLFGLEAL